MTRLNRAAWWLLATIAAPVGVVIDALAARADFSLDLTDLTDEEQP